LFLSNCCFGVLPEDYAACLLGAAEESISEVMLRCPLKYEFSKWINKAHVEVSSAVFCHHLQKLLLTIAVEAATCKIGSDDQAHSGYKKGMEAPREKKMKISGS